MAVYENYITGDNGDQVINDATDAMAQTFTPSASHEITSVRLKLLKGGGTGTPGTVTVTIHATDDNNKPTGDALATGTINGNDFDTSPGSFKIITFTAGYNLTAGIIYAIKIVCPGASGASTCHWRLDSTGAYADGNQLYSTDGTTWSATTNYDFMFEERGNPIADPPSTDGFVSKKLVAVGGGEVWYESAAGTMSQLAASIGQLNTANPVDMFEGFQKAFIFNGTTLRVADFANTKLTVATLTTAPTKGSTVTQTTSGATMIVDFVNTAKTEIYGYTTSGTFVTTGGYTLSGGSMDPETEVPSAVDEASAIPHWYAYTVYSGNAGTMPTQATIGCLYRGRVVIAGDSDKPHQWVMSRVGDPFDLYYDSTDPLTAVKGGDADAGEIGDIITALVPYKDDYLVIGCSGSVWLLIGDPASGGQLAELSLTTGIWGQKAWCFDDSNNFYFFGLNGLYKTTIQAGSISSPINISATALPTWIADWDLDDSLHRVTLTYDAIRQGIVIAKTVLSTGVCVGYWHDLRTEGFYPESYPSACGIFSSFYYNATDATYRKLLFGTNDGYLRYFLDTKKDDETGVTDTAISSYMTLPIQQLSEDLDKEGKLTSLTIELAGGKATTKLTHTALTTAHGKGDTLTQATSGATMKVLFTDSAKTNTYGYAATGTFNTTNAVTGSGVGTGFTPTAVGTGDFADTDGVTYELHRGDDAETCLENIRNSAAAFSSGTLSGAGRKARIRTRVRGGWLGIKLYNSTAAETFAINKIYGTVLPAGRIK